MWVAGNHDHNGNITAQVEYSKVSDRWNYPDLWHTVTKSVTIDGKVITSQFVALDLIVMMGIHATTTIRQCPVQITGAWRRTQCKCTPISSSHGFAWFDAIMAESTVDCLWVYGPLPNAQRRWPPRFAREQYWKTNGLK